MLNKTTCALGLACASAAGLMQPAAAQETPARVEVTGSSIPRAPTEGAAPLLVISRDQLARSGKSTLADYLQTLPLDGSGSLPASFGNGFAGGASAISLRGLGSTSTLILVNGRRLAAYPRADDGQKSFSDLSGIALEAVERIEILKDGASAVYGSDAIAGVVNIILRQDFVGTVLQASGGQSRYHDDREASAALTWGKGRLDRDGFNLLLSAEAYKSNGVQDRDRSSRAWIGQGDLRPWGYPAATEFSDQKNASPAGALLNPNTGKYVSLPGCASLSASAPGAAGSCLWHQDQFRSMEPQLERASLYGHGAWQLGAGMQAYAEAAYAKRESAFTLIPAYSSATFAGLPSAANPSGVTNWANAMLLAPSHPQNPYGVAVPVRYAPFDIGASTRHSSSATSRLVAGLKGAAMGWQYDTAYVHAESALDLRYTNMLNMKVLQAALSDPTSQYFPYYMGSEAARNPAALYAALVRSATSSSLSKLDSIDFTASRDLLPLPGGMLALAVGAQHRREQLDSPSLSGTADGAINASYITSKGDTRVSAVFAELVAPVLKELELSAAARHDRYAGFDSTTPKLGAQWHATEAFTVRGTYAEGFRAPSPVESNPLSQSTASSKTADPLRCPGGKLLPGANKVDCGITVAAAKVGNPDLQPERSKSYTLGLVWDALKDTSVALDGWKIRRNDEINPLTAAEAAALPTAVRDTDNLTIDGVVVPHTGTLLITNAPYRNSSYTEVKGVDLDIRQRLRLGEYGRATIGLNWSHLGSWLRVVSDKLRYQYAGTHGNCDSANCAGTPKDKISLSGSWERGAWNVTATANYRSDFKNTYDAAGPCASTFANGSEAPAGCKVASFTTVDLSLRWNASKNLQLFGSIENLFDKIAPLDPLTYGTISYNPFDAAGAIGRYFKAGARYQF